MADSRTCPACGQALTDTSPEGLCPRCLFEAGVRLDGETNRSAPPTSVDSASDDPFLDSASSLAGKTIGSFEIERELGRGGMGVVYKAHEQSLHRAVAVKLLAPHLAADRALVQRFQREARSAAQLNHPGIVTIYAVGEHEGRHYIAMEYVKGTPLSAYIAEAGQLPVSQALDIARQIASACVEAHAHGIVHRDIKPHNIMIDRAGRVKVLDFGLAKPLDAPTHLTTEGTHLGTPAFMSPEQIDGLTVDGRSDIFSLGVTLFAMLAGELPFRGEGPQAVMYQVVHAPTPSVRAYNAAVPVEIEQLLNRMLDKSPENRHDSAQALHDDLTRLAGVVTAKPRPSAPVPLAGVEASDGVRPSILWGATLLVTLVVAGLVFVLVANARRSTLPVATNVPEVAPTAGPALAPGDSPFADAKLATVIRLTLGKPVGAIEADDLEGLTYLSGDDAGITSLSGLERCTNLTTLLLARNAIEDLSPLAELTNLEVLGLHQNRIADISALAELTALRDVDLGQNQVRDITPLATLPNLEAVDLRVNRITDLRPLAGLAGLRRLQLSNSYYQVSGQAPGNVIRDWSPLAGLTGLEHLELTALELTDIQFLAGLRNLKRLILGKSEAGYSNNRIADISLVAEMPQLETLEIGYNGIASLDALRGLTRLRELYMGGNAVADLSPLAGLTNLTHLIMNNNDVADLSPLSGLNQLTVLQAQGNRIESLAPLSPLTQLTELVLGSDWRTEGGNRIADIGPVAALTQLQHLNLADNPVADVTPIGGLTQLETLNVSNLGLDTLAFLAPLTQLRHLRAAGNQITDLAPLAGASVLTSIDVSRNRISSVDALAALPALRSVIMDGNPVDSVHGLAANLQFAGPDAVLSIRGAAMSGTDYEADLTALAARDVTVYYTAPASGR